MIVVVAICASIFVVLWPVARLCARLGLSPWLGILAIVPIGNVLLLWFMAYAAWPIDGGYGSLRSR
ncbi:MAG: hypothetical protein JF601_05960 [Acidobacteria bacterium]|nr:hypothetical protein [Acidobacteriota bacterium]